MTARERPILFSAPMIRARRAGIKTQTRRVNKIEKLQPSTTRGYDWDFKNRSVWNSVSHEALLKKCPYGVVGDRLWVKETWSPDHANTYPCFPIVYRADGYPADEDVAACSHKEGSPVHDCLGCARFKWRPSIYMPRDKSRDTLEITNVRVQRLNEISEDDAKAEGVSRLTKDGTLYKFGIPDRDGLWGTDDDGWPWAEWEVNPRAAFRKLWESINGAGSWDENPLVWAITFAPFIRSV